MASISVPAAIVGAGVIGAGATAYGANQAASAQRSAANQANQTQQQFFNTTQENLKPFINTGVQASNKLSELQGLNGGTPSSIQATLESLPGYQFANYQGLKSVQNSASARGLGESGAALKGAANFSTGLANQYYNNLLSGLQTTQATGANAAGGLATAATNTGASIGQNIVGAGNAQAASNVATGTGIANAASSIPNSLIASQLLQNIQSNGSQSGIYGPPANSFNNYLNNPDPYNAAVAGVEPNELTNFGTL